MKKIWILLTLCCTIVACKKNDVQFTYLPAQPQAGATVTFTNQSTSGEDWAWSFGDGGSSTLKSPTHVYKRPGTYHVTLKVDNRSSWTASADITIYDSVPTFVASDTAFYIYDDYTFTANFYNPYGYEVSYQWSFPQGQEAMQVTDTTLTNSTLNLYFTQHMDALPIALTIVLNGDTTYIERSFKVQDKSTNSLYIRTAESDYRQRIFGDRADIPTPLNGRLKELDYEQDTMQIYNNFTFYLSDLQLVFPDMEGFHIANRKIYYRAGGLYVANIDGSNIVEIDGNPCSAMTLDMKDSRIYWADIQGVWYMPFVGSDNNKFVTAPVQINAITDVQKLYTDELE